MDANQFDRLARGLVTGATRRRLIGAIASGTVASFAAVGLRPHGLAQAALAARLQDADTEEQSVLLYEELAKIAKNHSGSCDKLAAETKRFLDENADLIKQIQDEQKAWSHEKRVAHADKYADRTEAATATLHFARARCRYAAGLSASATPEPCGSPAASLGAAQLGFLPAAHVGSCDCNSECPISTGWCIYHWAACTFGNDECMCCYSSYCGSTSHCMNDCTSNECCATPCSSAPVPPPPPA